MPSQPTAPQPFSPELPASSLRRPVTAPPAPATVVLLTAIMLRAADAMSVPAPTTREAARALSAPESYSVSTTPSASVRRHAGAKVCDV